MLVAWKRPKAKWKGPIARRPMPYLLSIDHKNSISIASTSIARIPSLNPHLICLLSNPQILGISHYLIGEQSSSKATTRATGHDFSSRRTEILARCSSVVWLLSLSIRSTSWFMFCILGSDISFMVMFWHVSILWLWISKFPNFLIFKLILTKCWVNLLKISPLLVYLWFVMLL